MLLAEGVREICVKSKKNCSWESKKRLHEAALVQSVLFYCANIWAVNAMDYGIGIYCPRQRMVVDCIIKTNII